MPDPFDRAAELRTAHRHGRRHHRAECRCDQCRTDGLEPCSVADPCPTCRAGFPQGPRPARDPYAPVAAWEGGDTL
jgi:hypothetical protein